METLLDFTERGPHPVGVRTLDLPAPSGGGRVLPTDLWYPAATGVDAWRSDAEHPFARPHRAVADAPAGDGAFPLVVFSHGNSGTRRQSTFLTTHLASWGIAVVAPDHSGNTFAEMLAIASEDERIRVHLDARERRPDDALAALDAALAGDFGACALDAGRVAVCGHSFGGWTATKLPARDARIRAVCGLAPASEPFVGRKAYLEGELPLPDGVAALLVAGLDDVLVDIDTSVRPQFERLGKASALVGIRRADHFHFCDGIELLHGLHEANPRPKATRETLPFAETIDEARMHRLTAALVTRFFHLALASPSPNPIADASALDDAYSQERLDALDAALQRLS